MFVRTNGLKFGCNLDFVYALSSATEGCAIWNIFLSWEKEKAVGVECSTLTDIASYMRQSLHGWFCSFFMILWVKFDLTVSHFRTGKC